MKKVWIQIQAEQRDREMLAELARHRGLNMSQVVRQWIRESHKRMQREIKKYG